MDFADTHDRFRLSDGGIDAAGAAVTGGITALGVLSDRAISLLSQIGCVGRSEAFCSMIHTAEMLAQHRNSILITGETGSGKELIAKFVHGMGAERKRPMVTVNCGAIPSSLAESLLLGHAKGAFTGAVQKYEGVFMQADGGTLFLDEIGELPLPLQAKLLRVVEDGIVVPLGACQPREVSVRLISATNKNLSDEVEKGNFREDLYYRLCIGEIRIPPLRERPEDIHLLADYFLRKLNSGLAQPKQFSEVALSDLEKCLWKGNI
jgi:two-component system response regulator AtoC